MKLARAVAAGTLAAMPAIALADGPAAPPASWPVAGGIVARLALPSGAEPIPDDALPKLDLAGVDDAKVVLRRGVRRAPATPEHVSDAVAIVCATAPGTRLPAEAVPIVLDKVAEMVRTDLAKTTSIERFEEGLTTEAPGRWDQSFTFDGRLTVAGAKLPVHVEGRRIVGFFGSPPEALVCAVVCTEVSSEGARVCPDVAASLRYEGAFTAPPRASLPSRVLFAAVRRPLPAVGALLGLLLFLAGVVTALVPPKRGRISSA